VKAQMTRTLRNVEAILAAAGTDFGDVVIGASI
jgi:enamine deaminase RidA (YjgF/YER057c/UK114 family)